MPIGCPENPSSQRDKISLSGSLVTEKISKISFSTKSAYFLFIIKIIIHQVGLFFYYPAHVPPRQKNPGGHAGTHCLTGGLVVGGLVVGGLVGGGVGGGVGVTGGGVTGGGVTGGAVGGGVGTAVDAFGLNTERSEVMLIEFRKEILTE
jgi:hypothetical protein